ncbi:MAG: four helix bundle protein [Anaerolineales bacterium]|uniref:four helix bundle protein n=1 Tax=Promineifilum sp. TaxID=2664178 RepID=UPI001E0998EF|nr:four helix bundle protein [Anaerolineales bacterium]MCB8934812.1 four helix bundle protein [Promineifilum sp.]MCO5181286.1 four helix bundle protein [Promineifilum sp.]
MSEYPLRERTKQLALRIIHLVEALPNNETSRIIGRQLVRSGTSVGASYRASLRAKSKADMLNKWKIVEEEVDETLYWLELMVEANIMPEAKLKPLMNEVDEITAMMITSISTLRRSNHS